MEYILKFRNREVARGGLMKMLTEADARNAIVSFTPSRRGWKWSRMLLDLSEDVEIVPSGSP